MRIVIISNNGSGWGAVGVAGSGSKDRSWSGTYTQTDDIYNSSEQLSIEVRKLSGYSISVSGDYRVSGLRYGGDMGSYVYYMFKITETNARINVTYTGAPTTYSVSTSVGSGYGSVSGGGTYNSGSSVTIRATPNYGYELSSLVDTGTGGHVSNPYTFNIYSNKSFVAYFTAIPSFNVNVSKNIDEGGTVTGGGTYLRGNQASINATVNPGYEFIDFVDTDTGGHHTDRPWQFNVTRNYNIVANYRKIPEYNVKVNIIGNGSVSGSGTFFEHTQITLLATPDIDSRFLYYVDVDTGGTITSNPYLFTLNEDKEFNAYFEQIPSYFIQSIIHPSGSGVVNGAGWHLEHEDVTLEAVPNITHDFDYMVVDNIRTEEPTFPISDIQENHTVEAYFVAKRDTYYITVSQVDDILLRPLDIATIWGDGNHDRGTTAELYFVLKEEYVGVYKFSYWIDDRTGDHIEEERFTTPPIYKDLSYKCVFHEITYINFYCDYNSNLGVVTLEETQVVMLPYVANHLEMGKWTFKASAYYGATFQYWEHIGYGTRTYTPSIYIDCNTNKHYACVFEQITGPINVDTSVRSYLYPFEEVDGAEIQPLEEDPQAGQVLHFAYKLKRGYGFYKWRWRYSEMASDVWYESTDYMLSTGIPMYYDTTVQLLVIPYNTYNVTCTVVPSGKATVHGTGTYYHHELVNLWANEFARGWIIDYWEDETGERHYPVGSSNHYFIHDIEKNKQITLHMKEGVIPPMIIDPVILWLITRKKRKHMRLLK